MSEFSGKTRAPVSTAAEGGAPQRILIKSQSVNRLQLHHDHQGMPSSQKVLLMQGAYPRYDEPSDEIADGVNMNDF